MSGDLVGARETAFVALNACGYDGSSAALELLLVTQSCDAALEAMRILEVACSRDPSHPILRLVECIRNGSVVHALDLLARYRLDLSCLQATNCSFSSSIAQDATITFRDKVLAARFLDVSRPVRACFRAIPFGARVLVIQRHRESGVIHVAVAARTPPSNLPGTNEDMDEDLSAPITGLVQPYAHVMHQVRMSRNNEQWLDALSSRCLQAEENTRESSETSTPDPFVAIVSDTNKMVE